MAILRTGWRLARWPTVARFFVGSFATVGLLGDASGIELNEVSGPVTLLESHDPLSCALQGTGAELCSGTAGAWQLGRLALAVEASAKALEIAGAGRNSRDLQTMIFRDGAAFGFNLALITPTIALLDIASLGLNGPLGKRAPEVSSLSMLSLEALYPGMSTRLGMPLAKLPGVTTSPSGFTDFESFARAVSSRTSNRAPLDFAKFMPFRHQSLAGSEPVLKLIPGISGEISKGTGLGPSVNDFLFSHSSDPRAPAMNPKGAFAGLPVSLALTESLALAPGTGRKEAADLSVAPFGGGACLTCGSSRRAGAARIDFRSELREFGNPSAQPAGMSGGHFLDSFGSRDAKGVAASTPEGSAAATGIVSADSAEPTGGDDKVVKKVGTSIARKGIAAVIGAKVGGELGEKIAKWGGGGPIGAAIGVFMEHERISCDPGEVSKPCGNAVEKTKQNEPKDPVKPKDEPKLHEEKNKKTTQDKEPAPKEPKPKQNSAQGTGGSESAATTAAGSETTRPRPEGPADPQGPSRPHGPRGCSPADHGTVSYCTSPLYRDGERPCVADRHGEVSCFGSNVIAESVLEQPPFFVALTVDKTRRLVALEGRYENLLFGDLAQASILASLDSESFDLSKFEPVRDGGSAAKPLFELLHAQPDSFYETGFARRIGLHRDGGSAPGRLSIGSDGTLESGTKLQSSTPEPPNRSMFRH